MINSASKSCIKASLKALALVAMLFAVAGCVDKSNPDRVEQRAIERWNFLIEHKAESAYDYLSPGFRQTQSREAYAASMNNRPLQWKSVKFDKKDCDKDRCLARIALTYVVTMPGLTARPTESTSTQAETWIFVDGDWYFLPK